jgi:hypothetical protein
MWNRSATVIRGFWSLMIVGAFMIETYAKSAS